MKISSSRQWKCCWHEGSDPGMLFLLTLPKSCKDTKGLVIVLQCHLNSFSKSLNTFELHFKMSLQGGSACRFKNLHLCVCWVSRSAENQYTNELYGHL